MKIAGEKMSAIYLPSLKNSQQGMINGSKINCNQLSRDIPFDYNQQPFHFRNKVHYLLSIAAPAQALLS